MLPRPENSFSDLLSLHGKLQGSQTAFCACLSFHIITPRNRGFVVRVMGICSRRMLKSLQQIPYPYPCLLYLFMFTVFFQLPNLWLVVLVEFPDQIPLALLPMNGVPRTESFWCVIFNILRAPSQCIYALTIFSPH